MNKICKGDEVIVIAGKDKNKRGTVRVWLDENRVIVGGINLAKKHVKPNPVKGGQGGIVTKEMPINISNVSLFNPSTKKADRVGFKILDDGRKVRVFKSNGEIIVKA
jgi:large subunit ribosomal protein L24